MNALGWFVNVVSDRLNRNSESRAAAWAVQRLGRSRFWRLRTEAAWIISEQVSPSKAHLELLWQLLHDQHPRVLSSAAEGFVEHASRFPRVRLEAGLNLLKAAPTDDWAYPRDNETIKEELVDELQSVLDSM